MRLFGVLLIAIVAGISGCAVQRQPMGRDEWVATTTRAYDGITKERVLQAAERLLRLADGNDFVIAYSDDGFSATRNWLMYAVITAASGTDFWQVTASTVGATTSVSVRVNLQMQSMMAIPTGAGGITAAPGLTTGLAVSGTALYDVFWARMDYLLGRRAEWMTCQTADARVSAGITWGLNEPLCNAFNVNDDSPSGPLSPENVRQR